MWKVVDEGEITRQKVEIMTVNKKADESIEDFLYRVFHSYPPEYEVQVNRFTATIIRRISVKK